MNPARAKGSTVMHAQDRHLARARSKAHTQDTRKDEARAYVRASRRAGKVNPREIEDEAAGADDVVAGPMDAVDMTDEEEVDAELARWEEKREIARVLSPEEKKAHDWRIVNDLF